MKLKKVIAAAAATAVAVSAMAVTTFAGRDGSDVSDGTAFLVLNDANWATPDGTYTDAEITGDGTYTVSVKGCTPWDMGPFNALDIKNGETVNGRTYVVTIDSISINGSEVFMEEGYTQSADGAGITTRVNIYNEYNTPTDEPSDDGTMDCRSADGDFMSKTAQMVSPDDARGITDMEVTFTVSGLSAGGADASADTAAPASDGATTSSGTGNTASAVILSVMAAAGAAAVASRKRK